MLVDRIVVIPSLVLRGVEIVMVNIYDLTQFKKLMQWYFQHK